MWNEGDRDPLTRAIDAAIGAEITRRRTGKEFTRGDVVSVMSGRGASVQSLQNYEYGIRSMTVTRLYQVCRAIDEYAPDVLAVAIQHVEADADTVLVDLHVIVTLGSGALCRWAQSRLARDPGKAFVKLDPERIADIAAFLDLDSEHVRDLLREFTPGQSGTAP
jgi:hypothetical protein